MHKGNNYHAILHKLHMWFGKNELRPKNIHGRAAARTTLTVSLYVTLLDTIAPPDGRDERNTRTAVEQAEQLFTNAIKDVLCVFY